jgi:hypothetical protein
MQPALRNPIPDASLAVFPVNGENDAIQTSNRWHP